MLAIPVLRSRVAPVFNWCSRILLIPEDAPDSNAGAEMILSGVSDPFERLTVLRQKGADTLICGALSPDLFHYADHLQLRIICGIAGDIEEVLQPTGAGSSINRASGCRDAGTTAATEPIAISSNNRGGQA